MSEGIWILPSRGRPHNIKRLFEHWALTDSTTGGILAVDDDDPKLNEYRDCVLPDNWKLMVFPRLSMCAKTNAVVLMDMGREWYGYIDDDALPRTKHWDRLLVDAASSDGIAYCWNGIKNEALASQWVIAGDLIREWGWMMLPGLSSIYGDDVVTAIGRKRGILHYLPDVKLEQMHFSNGKAPIDETYKKSSVIEDRKIYFDWYYKEIDPVKPVTFVFLKAGEEYSSEYVNILANGIERSLPDGFPARFVCITDNSAGLDAGIAVLPLPDDLETWWGKLYMFKRGLFAKDERMIFMDLDTVITGRLDDIFKYDGEFATLRDFYQPERVGPAVIAWKADGIASSIWDEWVAEGRPRNEMGDLWWLNNLDQGRFSKEVDILQDLYPDKFVSYKKDCLIAPPATAAVICFHGLPRPHQVEGWVKLFWKKDGYCSSDFEVVCNTEIAKVKENIQYSSNLDLPWIEIKPETNRKIVICGGAPSLKDSLDEIRELQEDGALIVGLNGSANFLVENDIQPDWSVMIDSRESNIEFVGWLPAKEYFIASQCAPIVFDWLSEEKATLFHIDIPNIGEYVLGDRPIQAIGGGSTVGLLAMSLAYTQGFRDIHLYGYDSSIHEDEGHAYPQEDESEVIEAEVEGRKFKSTPWMITQVNQWQQLSNQLRQLGCNVTVHGDGLLPYLAWVKSTQENLIGETA